MVSKSAANRDRLAAGQWAYRMWRARHAGKVLGLGAGFALPGSSGVVARSTSPANFRWLASSRSASSVRPASPRPGSGAEPRFVIPRASVTAAATTARPPAGDANDTSPSANTSPRPSPLFRRNPVVLTRLCLLRTILSIVIIPVTV